MGLSLTGPITPYESSWARHEEMIRKAKTNRSKGQYNGDCNRTQCQQPRANWWNRGTDAYYCACCARAINDANRDIQPPLCSLDETGAHAREARKNDGA